MAVSGQNLAFVLVVFSPLLTRLSLRGRWFGGAVLLGWFVLVTRAEPSVVRAAAMAVVVATAAWFGRHASGVRIAFTAVSVVLLLDPMLVWSVGFQLSVAAVIALIVLTKRLARRIPGPRWLSMTLAASLAAQVGTAPILLSFTDSVPLFAPLFNVMAVPVAGWLMMWGLVATPIAGILGDPFATSVGWVSAAMLEWLSAVAWLGADSRWPRLGVSGVASMVAGVVLFAYWDSFLERLPGRSFSRVGVSILAVSVLGIVCDSSKPMGSDREYVDSGVSMWTSGGSTVMVLEANARDRSMLDLLHTARVSRVDTVVVSGGGLRTSASVLLLREVSDVGAVIAADPSSIRGSTQLREGRFRVGNITFDVAEGDSGWTVSQVPP